MDRSDRERVRAGSWRRDRGRRGATGPGAIVGSAFEGSTWVVGDKGEAWLRPAGSNDARGLRDLGRRRSGVDDKGSLRRCRVGVGRAVKDRSHVEGVWAVIQMAGGVSLGPRIARSEGLTCDATLKGDLARGVGVESEGRVVVSGCARRPANDGRRSGRRR